MKGAAFQPSVVTATCLLLGLGIGCGSQPIPKFAVAGTTITILLPRGFYTGYGLAATGSLGDLGTSGTGVFDVNLPYDPSSGLEDPQRGEMVFELVDAVDETHVAYLPVRYITRLAPQEGSPGASKTDSYELRSYGQAIAMLDVPASVPAPADYKIKVLRYLRNETTLVFEPQPEAIDTTPWYGWGSSSDPSDPTGIPIRIEPGDGVDHFTPYRGWDDFFGNLAGGNPTNIQANLLDAIPYPYVWFLATYDAGGGTSAVPGAWQMDLEYPRKRVAIRNVALQNNEPSSALARYQVLDPEPVDCNDGGDTGTVRIQVIDPDASSAGIRVSFELLNFGQSCGGRAVSADFVVATGSARAYDTNGNPQTLIVGSSLIF